MSANQPLAISAIIITKNEGNNIGRCLKSLDFVSEVVVVDSGSTDNTISIVSQFPNAKLLHKPWIGFSENKQFAIDAATHEWIFWVDADEEVTQELKTEINEFFNSISSNSTFLVGGVYIPRKTFFLGTWIRHSGWYPGYVCRLFHKKRAMLNGKKLHEGIEVLANYKKVFFKENLLHYSYTSLYQYFDKMNRYGSDGANELYRKGSKVSCLNLFFQPLYTFIKFYFLKKGFLDGVNGLVVCLGAAFSNFIKYTNLYYLNLYKKHKEMNDKKNNKEKL